ncbi:hypothetical protein QO010_000194 [Caulobacter ginsengisoli]|uniref:Uncharacterized protein n=1 Tax=Caulobacter ginsengisoli TaxID=400775 RepID=A0ABU0IKB0_9CAUL|nr:hypothetical protein [Caulobacter ginsengisoli]MDQ0462446.1 hypothetical protein [Caulobacter ginsengisoli]
MDLSQFNWSYFALGVSALLLLLWFMGRSAGKPGAGGMLVSLPFLVVAMLNTAAPVRGMIDPSLTSYQFGMLSAPSGWMLAATAGGIFLIALVASLAALRPGRVAGLVVAVAGLLFATLLGWPWLQNALSGNLPPVRAGGIVLPGMAAAGLFFLVTVAPFLVAAVWGLRRLATGR